MEFGKWAESQYGFQVVLRNLEQPRFLCQTRKYSEVLNLLYLLRMGNGKDIETT